MITKQQIEKEGFIEYGLDIEDDPYFQVTFLPPHKFNISHLSGQLQQGVFWCYGNDTYYEHISEIQKLIKIISHSVIYKPFSEKKLKTSK